MYDSCGIPQARIPQRDLIRDGMPSHAVAGMRGPVSQAPYAWRKACQPA